jgi:hypothetical protein
MRAYAQRVVTPNRPGTGLRRQAISVLMVAGFALVCAGAAAVANAALAMEVLARAGIIGCLAGWRMIVIARRRERQAPNREAA